MQLVKLKRNNGSNKVITITACNAIALFDLRSAALLAFKVALEQYKIWVSDFFRIFYCCICCSYAVNLLLVLGVRFLRFLLMKHENEIVGIITTIDKIVKKYNKNNKKLWKTYTRWLNKIWLDCIKEKGVEKWPA